MRSRTARAAAAALGLLALGCAGAQRICTGRANLALDGYDPVAYLADGRAVRGAARYGIEWKGAIWWFASEENRHQFMTDPDRRMPQYGGFCALAMTRGRLVRGDPALWAAVGRRVFLFADAQSKARWEQDISGNVRLADAAWTRKRPL